MRVPQYSRFYLALPVALLLGACTTVPTGPSVMVLPGTGMSLERFRADEAWCREDALRQIGGQSASDNQRQATLNSAAIGTAIGTVAGLAIGGSGRGAAVGAGVGLIAGSAAGSDAGRQSAVGSQRQYDNAYIQCMYAKGHKVPVPASMASRSGKPATSYGTGTAYPPPPGQPPSSVPPDYQPQQPFYYPQPQ